MNTRIPKKMFETAAQRAARMKANDARAKAVGMPKLLVGEYDDEEIAEGAAKKHMTPPTSEMIETVKQLRKKGY